MVPIFKVDLIVYCINQIPTERYKINLAIIQNSKDSLHLIQVVSSFLYGSPHTFPYESHSAHNGPIYIINIYWFFLFRIFLIRHIYLHIPMHSKILNLDPMLGSFNIFACIHMLLEGDHHLAKIHFWEIF